MGHKIDTDEKRGNEARYNHLTEAIIGAAYKVANTLGSGFLEKCYENALAYELAKRGFKVEQQVQLKVWYEEVVVGEFVADLVVNGTVLVELKAIERLEDVHSAQGINYLAATGLPLCLLINFGRRVDIRRLAGPSLQHVPTV